MGHRQVNRVAHPLQSLVGHARGWAVDCPGRRAGICDPLSESESEETARPEQVQARDTRAPGTRASGSLFQGQACLNADRHLYHTHSRPITGHASFNGPVQRRVVGLPTEQQQHEACNGTKASRRLCQGQYRESPWPAPPPAYYGTAAADGAGGVMPPARRGRCWPRRRQQRAV